MSRALSIYDRRRLAVAALVTLVALPALWWAKRDTPIATPSVAAVDVAGGLDVGATKAADIAGIGVPPGYLTGAYIQIDPLLSEPSGPPIEDSFTRGGLASYRTFPPRIDADGKPLKRDPETERLCQVSFLPDGLRITVENTDNGQRIECRVDRTRLDEGLVLVLDISLFDELSDLAEAPIPVRIRW